MSQASQPFIAIEPPFTWSAALSDAQALLCGRFDYLRWTAPQRFHVSLMSLKHRSGGSITQVVEALEHAAADFEPFELQIGSLRLFGRERRPHTLCADVHGDVRELRGLRRAIHRALAPLGFRSTEDSFTPHITLAKQPDPSHDDAIGSLRRAVMSIVVPPTEPFRVGRVHLIRNELPARTDGYEQIVSAMIGVRERGC